jgi:hypothetical protein
MLLNGSDGSHTNNGRALDGAETPNRSRDAEQGEIARHGFFFIF